MHVNHVSPSFKGVLRRAPEACARRHRWCARDGVGWQGPRVLLESAERYKRRGNKKLPHKRYYCTLICSEQSGQYHAIFIVLEMTVATYTSYDIERSSKETRKNQIKNEKQKKRVVPRPPPKEMWQTVQKQPKETLPPHIKQSEI